MALEQKTLHIITEALALPFGIFLIWVGSTIKAKKWIKVGLIIGGIGNILIDTYMLTTW